MIKLIMTDPPANLGDVRIHDAIIEIENDAIIGDAQIYFTDGFAPNNWSYICMNNFRPVEAKVFCNELGYLNGTTHPSTVTNP